MTLSLTQGLLVLISGCLVGFTLGLVGGGGSILAVPLMVYLVGVSNPHVAIGTSAMAVATSAAVGLANHARSGTVKWHCSLIFAAAGVVGALLGSSVGKHFDGQKLLALFALLMIVVGITMLRKRRGEGDGAVQLNRSNLSKLITIGLGIGTLSGFFGIGGGFLIVPGLMLATGMPILNAIGSSLVGVTAFALTTATNYAISGLIDWALAAMFLGGGAMGGMFGTYSAKVLGPRKGALNTLFAGMIFIVALYMLARTTGIL
jgi:uncharacterized protein